MFLPFPRGGTEPDNKQLRREIYITRTGFKDRASEACSPIEENDQVFRYPHYCCTRCWLYSFWQGRLPRWRGRNWRQVRGEQHIPILHRALSSHLKLSVPNGVILPGVRDLYQRLHRNR